MLAPSSPSVRLLLAAWREVSRHLDLESVVRALTPGIAALVPIRRVLVRGIDRERGRVTTIAAGGEALEASRSTLERDDLGLLGRWASSGAPSVMRPGESGRLWTILVPTGVRGPALVGPLGEGCEAVLILEVPGEATAHLPLMTELLEPFSAALANDQRLHEVARLREATEAENRALLTRLQRQDVSEAIIGAEAGLRPVMERVDQVSRTDAPVLILGETGSGKEVVARAIHTRSRRAAGPFLRINCGAIPPELVDSELFGHERGSFTGATGTRQGWFERADGGTLFLDEIGELPPAAQVRLLRVLQDGSFERVGGQQERSADVRIVAATHRDMVSLVRSGQFREDLWYRVSVFPIYLPPLRERRDDITALVHHFSSRAGLRLFGVPLVPSAEEIRLLFSYDWPGNVRELAAVIERAAILGDGRRLEVKAALGRPVSRELGGRELLSRDGVSRDGVSRETGNQDAGGREAGSQEHPQAGALEAANRRVIVEALERARGRIEGPFGAAALLGVNPHTLRSRMRKMQIIWSQYRNPAAS